MDILVDIRNENSTIRDYYGTDMVQIETILNSIEDLFDEIDALKEQVEDLKREKDSLYYMGSSNQYEYGE